MTNPILVNTFYGAMQAHFDLSLEVGEGRIVSLLGGNASGKSTTMESYSASSRRAQERSRSTACASMAGQLIK
jgi:ABC-type branched-subunit amino acid transport system ATPase component